jgi:hypothetical protein
LLKKTRCANLLLMQCIHVSSLKGFYLALNLIWDMICYSMSLVLFQSSKFILKPYCIWYVQVLNGLYISLISIVFSPLCTRRQTPTRYGREVYYPNDLPMDGSNEFEDKCSCTGRYIDNDLRQLNIERGT